MSTDIYTYVRVQDRYSNQWSTLDIKLFPYTTDENRVFFESEPFLERDYHIFAFLGGVKDWLYTIDNLPTDWHYRGLPEQSTEEGYHSSSYVKLEELLAFNYDELLDTQDGDFQGQTFREFLTHLNDDFFNHLSILAAYQTVFKDIVICYSFG